MATQLTASDAKQSLNAHVAAKGAEIFEKYGPSISWPQLQAILKDRACVRYPCELVFDSARLNPGEFAHPEPKGDRPEEGFTLLVHPVYMTQLGMVPCLALYQLVAVNYGEFASADDAETFASQALGLPREEYYQILCGLADQLGGGIEPGPNHGPGVIGCGGGGCGCGSP
jgi:hypothetical protein